MEGCCSCTSASSTPPHAFLSSTPEILDFRASLMIKCSSHIVLAGFELEFYWGNEPISLYIQKEPFCDLFRRHKTEDRRMNYAMPSFWAPPLAEGLFRRQGVLSDGNGDTTIQNRVTLARRPILDNTLNKSWWHTLPPKRRLLWAIDQKVVTHRKASKFIHTLIKGGRLLLNVKKATPSTDTCESNW